VEHGVRGPKLNQQLARGGRQLGLHPVQEQRRLVDQALG
jgi:hypothetical protein